MSGHPNRPRPTMDDFKAHFELCHACSMFAPCEEGAQMLAAAIQTTSEQLAPIPDIPRSPWKA